MPQCLLQLIVVVQLWELESEGLGVQGQPQIWREFKASLGYKRPCFIKQNNKEQINNYKATVIQTVWDTNICVNIYIHLKRPPK